MAWLKSFANGVQFTPSAILSTILLTFALTLIISQLLKRSRKIRQIDQIPGPKTIPIFGNALEVNVKPRDLFLRLVSFCDYNTEGQLVRVWIGATPYVLIYKFKGAEVILSSQKHIDKSKDYAFLFPWLGTGLLTATGKKWHNRRKMLTPAFHFKILEDFVDIFNQQSFKLASLLKKKANGDYFDIFQFITLCTLDIILETAMGRNIDAQNNSDSDYVKALYKISGLIQKRQSRPWLKPNILFRLLGYGKQHDECIKILHGFSYETIRQRKKEFNDLEGLKEKELSDEEMEKIGKTRKRLAFLDLLLKYSEESGLTEEDIREEVDTFMFEGHDTTAAGINWTIYLLGRHPDIQKQVHDELDSIFGDSDRPVKTSDLVQLKYLDCCIKEALRLYPSVPFIGRELKEEVVIDGYRIPPGTTALIITYRLHRDPDQFPEPELFKPERFFPENTIGRHPFAYVPFSAGPRNCIGQKFAQMEEKIVLANIFRNYRVESDTCKADLKILGELILRPEDGNNIKLFSRRK